jgi:cysteine-rich repeat protein
LPRYSIETSIEICGDGKKMGLLPCDDGNTRSGDGCSSDCALEPFYECLGGNENRPDVCVERKPPEISVFRYFANRTAVLYFSERVEFLRTVTSQLCSPAQADL